jgi:hypothetical protein
MAQRRSLACAIARNFRGVAANSIGDDHRKLDLDRDYGELHRPRFATLACTDTVRSLGSGEQSTNCP